MTKAPKLSELNDVERWRLEQLMRLGFNASDAEGLLHIQDVAHKAADLLEADVPHDVAFWKLRDEGMN